MDRNQLYNRDCIEGMKEMPENSVDAFVTDPPYGLEFMGKEWDKLTEHTSPSAKGTYPKNRHVTGYRYSECDGFSMQEWHYVWAVEALRVAKPGAHMLAFGGTRTHHRLMVAIEDAGWEIRDTVAWVYGCLSEDTEVLTQDGWEHYHKSKKSITDKTPIIIYDIQEGIFKWEVPERWNKYRVEQDTCYRIQSDHTDQLVSRNHRCLVEREGKLVFVSAEQLSDMENMPTLPDNFLELCQRQPEILLSPMQRILSWAGIQKMGKDWRGLVKSTREQTKEGKRRREESRMERWYNLFQDAWKLCWGEICALPERIFGNGSERWVCNGTPFVSCSIVGEMPVTCGSSSSYRSRSNQQYFGEFNAIQEQSRSQKSRRYGITRAKVTTEKYTGIIFCPTVSTGAFVARRNGKIFITGNSGFPKSLDVSKAIDKAAGVEREVIGTVKGKGGENLNKLSRVGKGDSEDASGCGAYGQGAKQVTIDIPLTIPATPSAKQWQGWGSSLKPAWEPIVLCRKPFEGTVAENVLKWGTGAINIDAGRVPTTKEEHKKLDDGRKSNRTIRAGEVAKGYGMKPEGLRQTSQSTLGRFPANFIHDGSDEVLELFPDTQTSKGNYIRKTGEDQFFRTMGDGRTNKPDGLCDSGSAARFFYCAKASRSEREAGLEDMEEVGRLTPMAGRGQPGLKCKKCGKWKVSGSPCQCEEPEWEQSAFERPKLKNTHPTVKPISLMRYLCKLITQPNGIILDPFLGSGSTGIAASLESFRFIGFEVELESFVIAQKRIAYWTQYKTNGRDNNG
jgi:site-specific DNA-methyltransferase (adenine-specific)